jgi:hypothetical protein
MDAVHESELAREPLQFRAVRPVADDRQLPTRVGLPELANRVIKRLVAIATPAKQDQEVGVGQAELLAQRPAITGPELVSLTPIGTLVRSPARLRLKRDDLLRVLARRHQDAVGHA